MKTIRPLTSLLIMALILVGCGGQKTPEAIEETAIPVALDTIRTEAFNINYHSIGRVVSENQVNLLFQSAGQVEEIWVEVGQYVKKDQALASINTDVYSTMYAQARSMYEKAKSDLASSEELFKSNVISSDQYQMARIGLDNARAGYTQAKNSLDNAILKAPFSGWIVSRNLNVGDLVSPGGAMQPPFVLADMERLKIIVPVPEARIGQMRVGLESEIEFKTFPDRQFYGRVLRVGMTPKDFSNNYDVEIRISGDVYGLKLGLIADVHIILERFPDAIVLPLNVIQDDGKDKYVFTADSSRAQRRSIEVKALAGSRVFVESDLKAGEALVVKGYSDLAQGVLLDIVE